MKFILFIYLWIIGSWLVNGYKFVTSDFESSYKREIIHGMGVVSPLSVITVWFDIDESKKEK